MTTKKYKIRHERGHHPRMPNAFGNFADSRWNIWGLSYLKSTMGRISLVKGQMNQNLDILSSAEMLKKKNEHLKNVMRKFFFLSREKE